MANIAFLLHKFPNGGIERVTINLIKPLVEKYGHRIFIYLYELNEQNLAEALPVTYIQLPYETWEKENKGFLEQSVVENKIDVLISTQVASDIVYNLKKKSLCKLAFVFHGHPFYEVKEIFWYIHNKPVKHKRAIKTAFRLFKKHVLTIPKFHLGVYRRRIVKQYKDIYKNTDAFGTLFDEYSQLIARAIGVKDVANSKLHTLRNPINKALDIPIDGPREKRVIYIGRLSRRDKRVDRLLMVWNIVHKTHPDWHLSIVGDGEDRENLEKIVADLKLPRVEFCGFTSSPEKFYANSEILCLTSEFEGCPMVLLEAQSYGCATMAFDCSYGVRDILSPNWENGVYVPNGEIEAYAEAMSRMMENDELRQKIQRNGLENVKRFSAEESARQYDALIQKLCSE